VSTKKAPEKSLAETLQQATNDKNDMTVESYVRNFSFKKSTMVDFLSIFRHDM